MENGCGTVGRAVASDTREAGFDSSNFNTEHLLKVQKI